MRLLTEGAATPHKKKKEKDEILGTPGYFTSYMTGCAEKLPVSLSAQFVEGMGDFCTCQDGSMATVEVNTHR